jgi:glyoxylase-like metal-dependent hydrolase (beta-lactamase superfamily II)
VPAFVCSTCGVQYPDSEAAPPACPICDDERQWVPADGQRWTTLDELRLSHRNRIEELEPGLTGVGSEPQLAIGQRALLVQAPGGNVLWDCVTLIDDETVEAIEALGGISAIAVSHPHYYSAVVEWSRAFGDVPVYLHAADRQWVTRPDPCVVYWGGETHELGSGLTLVRCGGHFDGAAVLHWASGCDGRGALLSADVLAVAADRSWVSFMYSYPNMIPLPAPAIRRIVDVLEPYPFERVYGAFWGSIVPQDGKAAVRRSADRYLRAITSGV